MATKGGYRAGEGRPESLGEQIEQSLRSLRTEAIGLYYLHRVDPQTPLEDSLGAIKAYVDRGAIRHVGVSEVSVEQIERARRVVADRGRAEPLQPRRPRARRRRRLLPREGIAFVPYFPLRGDGGNAAKLAWLLRTLAGRAADPGHALARPPPREPPGARRLSAVDRRAVLAAFDEQVRRHPEPEPPTGASSTTARDPLHQRRRRLERRDLERPGRRQRRRRHRRADQPVRRAAVGVEALLLRPAAGPARPAGRGGLHAASRPRRCSSPRSPTSSLDVPPPAGVELRAVVDQQGVDALVAVHDEVFGEDHSALRRGAARRLTRRPVASRRWSPWPGETPIAAGRVEFHPGTDFASLWGGGTLPAWRGRGVFRALVAHRAALASARGFRYLQVDAIAREPADPASGSASSSSPRPRRSCIRGRFRRRCACCPSS